MLDAAMGTTDKGLLDGTIDISVGLKVCLIVAVILCPKDLAASIEQCNWPELCMLVHPFAFH